MPEPVRDLLAVPMLTQSTDIYSGVARASGTLWATRWRLDETGRADTVLVFCHPSSNFLGHYALRAMAAQGVDAVGMTTRYIGNDSAMLLENCVVDVGACVAYLRELGYERIVLVGNSGGGELAALYQAQAEHPSLTSAPCSAGPDLTRLALPPADALVLLNAHIGRAKILTESLDAAVTDEQDPLTDRAPELDAFTREAPFSADFVAAYRAAQEARNQAITSWVEDRLALIGREGRIHDLPFVVHATCADPRMLDLSIEPTDRALGCLWGDVYAANFSPATLAHHTSLRAWLSQWSLSRSNGDGRRWLPEVSAPVQVLYGTADQGCFPSHARALYEAIGHHEKELVALPGATHYFRDQPAEIEHMCKVVSAWVGGLR